MIPLGAIAANLLREGGTFEFHVRVPAGDMQSGSDRRIPAGDQNDGDDVRIAPEAT
jgi:hypothetical protein